MEHKELEQIIELLKSQISTLQALVSSKDALILELQKQQIVKQNPIVMPWTLTPLITCDHQFPWGGTNNPTNCPKCGAYLGSNPYTILTSSNKLTLLKDSVNG